MHAVRLMLSIIAILTAWHGFKAFLGAETYANFHEFMFGDYVAYWDRYGGSFWGFLREQASREDFRPYIIAAAVIAGIALLLRFLTVSRNVCAIIAGVFLFNLGFWYFAEGEQPSTRFTLIGVGSLLWMALASILFNSKVKPVGVLRHFWKKLTS